MATIANIPAAAPAAQSTPTPNAAPTALPPLAEPLLSQSGTGFGQSNTVFALPEQLDGHIALEDALVAARKLSWKDKPGVVVLDVGGFFEIHDALQLKETAKGPQLGPIDLDSFSSGTGITFSELGKEQFVAMVDGLKKSLVGQIPTLEPHNVPGGEA